MNNTTIHKIFALHDLEQIFSIEKIEIGFTNIVFSINDRYIIKVCNDPNNENSIDREVFFYNFFKGKIPIPEILVYDKAKGICPYPYMIYSKIKGDNLYAKWHLLDIEERKNIVKEICTILKTINESDPKEYITQFGLQKEIDWKERICNKIEYSLLILDSKNVLEKDTIDKIRSYVNRYHYVLDEQDIRLVYWDIHFDNVLINNNKLSAILDFERTELCSVDLVLDTVRRMVTQPKKYVSAQCEEFIKEEDYAGLIDWFEEYYPELFKFKDMDKRIDLYSIEHDLDTLIHWPEDQNLKEIILNLVG